MNVAIIPARGGSKRIPRKNVRPFGGKPMIGHSINAALESGCFDHVVVSTDDSNIAEVSRALGADVPFLRPAALSDDHTSTRPVVNHAIEQVSQLYGRPEFVCCIYATAPFLSHRDLSAALSVLRAEPWDFVFSATSYAFPIQRALKVTSSGAVEPFFPEAVATRSQDLTEAYHDAAQFYWGRTSAYLGNLPMFGDRSSAFVLPRYRVQDIDTSEDWRRAELMFRALEQGIGAGSGLDRIGL